MLAIILARIDMCTQEASCAPSAIEMPAGTHLISDPDGSRILEPEASEDSYKMRGS